MPYHITQRGVDGRETFSCVDDRHTYLGLLRLNLSDAGVRLLGWCLMTNHVHLIAVPGRERIRSAFFFVEFMAATRNTTTRVPNAPATFGKTVSSPACSGQANLWTALAYVERNPLRARLVQRPEEYPWSNAPAHVTGGDGTGLLDMEWSL